MNKRSVGVIGTGFIGTAHIEALRRLGRVEVKALAGSSEEKALHQAQALGVEKAYGDWRQLVQDPDIDAVHICTPNHLHYDIAKMALEHGKHVICEKPLVTDVAQGEELIRLAAQRSLVHAVHFNLRYYPMVQQVKAYVNNNHIGKIFSLQGHYLQDWLLYETDYNWRMDTEISGKSRAIADIGSHLLDIAEYVTGSKVTHLCAQTQVFHPVRKKPVENVQTFSDAQSAPESYQEVSVQTEDYAAVLLKFDNGAVGNVTISQMAAGRKNQLAIELNGADGSLAWNSERANELWLGYRDKPNEVLIKDPQLMDESVRQFASYPGGHLEGFPDTMKQLFQQVYDYMDQRDQGNPTKPPFPTFEDGLREVMICEAILKSASENRWVEV